MKTKSRLMKTIIKYGKPPHQTAMLHGGPGAAGEMKPVAEILAKDMGVLELLQTQMTIEKQLSELREQLSFSAEKPVVLVGHSWGAWLGFLFASQNPDWVKKLILISAGSFETKFNADLIKIRLGRLNQQDREKLLALMTENGAGKTNQNNFRQFGRLMTIADAYDIEEKTVDEIDFNPLIHHAVWREAAELRDNNMLINSADKIKCPVVAIHGEHDPHPVIGVSKPLSERLTDFRMILLEKCGHTTWKERFARERFFEILRNEIVAAY
jgi:pimeloyl-ACP methyl ester carboxylesterase